jgi:hypothetical protein
MMMIHLPKQVPPPAPILWHVTFPPLLMWPIFSSHYQMGVPLDQMPTLMHHANAMSDADANSDHSPDAESPTTSQIQNPTPSRVTLPIYGHADFGYIDDTWLPGSDDMMDTDSE